MLAYNLNTIFTEPILLTVSVKYPECVQSGRGENISFNLILCGPSSENVLEKPMSFLKPTTLTKFFGL